MSVLTIAYLAIWSAMSTSHAQLPDGGLAAVALPSQAAAHVSILRHGADDPPGDDRGGKRGGGNDDPPGDDRGRGRGGRP